jgi:hypothetical protein
VDKREVNGATKAVEQSLCFTLQVVIGQSLVFEFVNTYALV